MGIFEWVSLAGLVAVGGIIWRLSWRLSSNTERIRGAETLAASASAKATILEQGLNDHKEHVAAEYVTRDAMKEFTAAINRLGDRLDNLFIHFIPKP